ncbi:MAG: type VI secretion system tip protein TssI/VgrG [Byssovorax sp.]
MPSDPLRYFLDLGGQTYRARELVGTEGVFMPFRFEIRFAEAEGAVIDPDKLVRSDVSLRLMRDGHLVRKIDGIASSISVGVAKNRAPEVKVVMEPRYAITKLRTDIRIFRKKTVPEVVVEVLNGLSVKTELRLSGTYERREYNVQFRESDFNFVERLLEDEGIFYFFLEGDVMVLGDTAASYEPNGPLLPFRAGSGLDRNEDAIFSMGARSAMGPSKMTLRDFNPEHPSVNMEVHADTPCPGGPEHYDYPGEYLDPGLGQKKVALRAEAVKVQHAAVLGKTFAGQLFPGGLFQVMGAPAPVEDGGYVVTKIEHAMDAKTQGFSSRFEALDADVIFRKLPTTEAPRLLNPITGIVTGPAGEDIYTDEWGRVKVHFHWDRLQPYDDTCSYWIPTVQDNTGHSVAIPRIGWEVLVHFLEGDPDRPVVLGRVYNADDTFPQRLPEMKTRSALKSLTSPRESRDSGNITGTNEIQFEDLVGEERIFIHAERDQNVVIANDKKEQVGNNETRVVKRDEKITIGANHTANIGGDFLPTVQGNQTWSVGGDRKVSVDNSDSANIQKDRTTTIGGMHFRRIGTDDRVVVQKNQTEKVGGVILEVALRNDTFAVEEVSSLIVGGAIVEIAAEGKMESAAKGRAETVGGLVYEQADERIDIRVDKTRETNVGASLSVDATKEMLLVGIEKLSTLSATGKVKGDKLTLRVGNSEITMKEGVIGVKAPDQITIDTTSDNVLGSGTSTQI